MDESQPNFETHMTEIDPVYLGPLPHLRKKYRRDGVNAYRERCHHRFDGHAHFANAAADSPLRKVISR